MTLILISWPTFFLRWDRLAIHRGKELIVTFGRGISERVCANKWLFSNTQHTIGIDYDVLHRFIPQIQVVIETRTGE